MKLKLKVLKIKLQVFLIKMIAGCNYIMVGMVVNVPPNKTGIIVRGKFLIAECTFKGNEE
jgi:hypothetical protein